MSRGALLVFLALSSAAVAAPPSRGSEDWELMAPYRDWVTRQYAPSGQWCCDWADGRPLFDDEWQQTPTGYRVLISRRHWADAPEPGVWIDVPRDRVSSPSPMGLLVVWWSAVEGLPGGFVYCVAPTGGV